MERREKWHRNQRKEGTWVEYGRVKTAKQKKLNEYEKEGKNYN